MATLSDDTLRKVSSHVVWTLPLLIEVVIDFGSNTADRCPVSTRPRCQSAAGGCEGAGEAYSPADDRGDQAFRKRCQPLQGSREDVRNHPSAL